RRHLLSVDDVLVGRDGEYEPDAALVQPVVGGHEGRAPRAELFRRERPFGDVVVERRVVGIEEPTAAPFDDGRGRRHAKPEQARFAEPAHERRTETKVVVEPVAQTVAEVGDRFPGAVEPGEHRHLAVLGARVGAVGARKVAASGSPMTRRNNATRTTFQGSSRTFRARSWRGTSV